ncbi:hypothetical protein F3Y22_tig00112738pilonHSYRG00339 [Hibiscus syriacus]|uniref:C3H1-type domain-containing protein n=1 Tax=Hibiscus syriacus TaxID=106335 RepID=A0A6A2WTT7_HIBSY|nr:hypothetical protein F3Y22_tig00112738pilonHSYRG00339 [Hibiscus syriacus]
MEKPTSPSSNLNATSVTVENRNYVLSAASPLQHYHDQDLTTTDFSSIYNFIFSPSSTLPQSLSVTPSSCSSSDDLEHASNNAATEHRLNHARLILEYQQLSDHFDLCFSRLQVLMGELETLRKENRDLRLANTELIKLLRLSSQSTAQRICVAPLERREDKKGIEMEVYNQGMVKTELCNKWQETGSCPYGDHCQFAHGIAELRQVIRHPRYKTQVCRVVLAGEACPYGHRIQSSCRNQEEMEEDLDLIDDDFTTEIRMKALQPFTLMDMENGYLLAKFKNDDDYEKVLAEGPWIIYGSDLTAQPWSRSFSTAETHLSTVMAWIRFPGLPEYMFKNNILTNIGNLVGRSVVYENLPIICFACGRFVHLREACQFVKSPTKVGRCDDGVNPIDITDGQANIPGSTTGHKNAIAGDQSVNSPYGPWMTVECRRRRNPIRKSNGKKSNMKEGKSQGSRFVTLTGEENGTWKIEIIPKILVRMMEINPSKTMALIPVGTQNMQGISPMHEHSTVNPPVTHSLTNPPKNAMEPTPKEHRPSRQYYAAEIIPGMDGIPWALAITLNPDNHAAVSFSSPTVIEKVNLPVKDLFDKKPRYEREESSVCGSYQISESQGKFSYHKPSLIALVKPRISGEPTDKVICKLGFEHPLESKLPVSQGAYGFFGTLRWNPNDSKRKALWRGLSHLMVERKPWLLAGDFNVILHCANKQGRSKIGVGCKHFSNFMDKHNLVDLDFKGPRLITVLSSSKLMYLKMVTKRCPFASWTGRLDILASPISFRKTSPSMEIFVSRISADSRSSLPPSKTPLTGTTISIFGMKGCESALSSRRSMTKNNLYNILRDEATRFFSELYRDDGHRSGSFPIWKAFPCLSDSDTQFLDAPVTNHEIRTALFEMGPLKSLGVNDMNALFYQSQWHTVGLSVCKWVKDIFNGKPFEPDINKAIIGLIPKKKNPESFTDFFLINLCTVLSKHKRQYFGGSRSHSFDEAKKGKTHWMAIKVDLEKANSDGGGKDVVNSSSNDTRSAGLTIDEKVDYDEGLCGRCRSGDNGSRGASTCEEMEAKRKKVPATHFLEHLGVGLAWGTVQESAKRLVYGSPNSNEKQYVVSPFLSQKMQKDWLLHYILPALDIVRQGADVMPRSQLNQVLDTELGPGWSTKLTSFDYEALAAASIGQATLMAIPNYFMQTMAIPKGTRDEIEKRSHCFIWGGSEEHPKMSLVNWRTCCQPMSHGGLGLCPLETQNEAFLIKLGYNFLTHPETLWVKVCRSKYKINSQLPIHLNARNCSYVWRSLSKVRCFVRNNVCWSLGNGQSTNYWTDTWIPGNQPIGDRIGRHPSYDPYSKVSEYVNMEDNWNLGQLTPTLDKDIIREITVIFSPNNGAGRYQPVWLWETSGICSVKKTYHMLHEEQWDKHDNVWQVAWKFDGPRRIRTFIWLILKNKLSTNLERTRKGISSDLSCLACGNSEESILHILRDCGSYNWKHMFDCIIWKLWKQGCNLIFNGAWKAPAAGTLKLNTDGSVKFNSMEAASGGLTRDHNVEWIVGYSRCIGRCSVPNAKLWGLLDDLHLAWNYGARRVVAEMDNAEAITLVTMPSREKTDNHKEDPKAAGSLEQDWLVEFALIPRGANGAADGSLWSRNKNGSLRVAYPSDPICQPLLVDKQACRRRTDNC